MQLIDSRFAGKQSAFAEAIGRSSAQVSHWVTGRKVIGPGTARNIEMSLGLPQGWFDDHQSAQKHEATSAVGMTVTQLVEVMAASTLAHRQSIVDTLMAVAAAPNPEALMPALRALIGEKPSTRRLETATTDSSLPKGEQRPTKPPAHA